MRVTPTQEQMAYLATIGASNSTIPSQPRSMEGQYHREDASPPHTTKRRVIYLLTILVVIMALVFFLVGIGRAEDKAPTVVPVAAIEDATPPHQESNSKILKGLTTRLATMENELVQLKKMVGHDDPRDQAIIAQKKIKGVEDRLKNELAVTEKKLQSAESSLNQIKSTVASLVKKNDQWKTQIEARIEANRSQADVRETDVKRIGTQTVDAEIMGLRENLAHQRQQLQRTRIWWISAVPVLAIALFIFGRIYMDKRIRQMEMCTPQLDGSIATHDERIAVPISRCADTRTEKNDSQGLNDSIKVTPKRSQSQTPMTPEQKMAEIIELMDKNPHIRIKPASPTGVWGLGLATIKGNVRAENQDFGLCFRIDGHDVLVVADGCGGIPHGQRASYLATINAAISIIRSYGTASRWSNPHVKDVATKAIIKAAHSLAIDGDKLNITDVRGGLRTTLIVVIGNQQEVGYSYIGDGGGCVVQSNGEIKHFLFPQKANGNALNVLAASLGPSMEGEPVSGVLKRETGDLILVGTDGVFDRVEDLFPKDVLRGCIQYHGDLQRTAEHIVEELASYKDTTGFICDDNLTLGIMGNGCPKLPHGFWDSSNDTEYIMNCRHH